MKPTHTLAITVAVVLIARVIGPYMDTLNVKENPHPKLRYDITLTIDGAPGPFDSVEGHAWYEVSSIDCVPVKGYPINPMRIPPGKKVPIAFNRISDSEYRATLYLDRLLDEDYFDLGVCHWSFGSMSALLKVNGATLRTGIAISEIIAQAPRTELFVAAQYWNNTPGLGNDHFGTWRIEQFKPEYAHGVFSVSTQAKESFE